MRRRGRQVVWAVALALNWMLPVWAEGKNQTDADEILSNVVGRTAYPGVIPLHSDRLREKRLSRYAHHTIMTDDTIQHVG